MSAQLQPEIGRIIYDEPGEVYYRRVLGEANNGALTIIDEGSPAHYLHWVSHPEDDESSTALAFGKAFHTATLEPELFGSLYTVLPADAPRDLRHLRDAKTKGDSTKASIEWWDEWDARSAGRMLLSASDYAQVVAMATSLRRYVMTFKSGGRDIAVKCGELFDECAKEVTVRWVDDETGLPCKARADLYAPDLNFAGDLKSCLNASRAAFSRAINTHRYHVQHAHYCEGFRACGAPLSTFGFFPVEKIRPHVAASWHIDGPSESRGWEIRQRSIRKLAHCVKTGEFPGYTTTVEPIGIPAYGHYDSDKD